MLHRDLSEAVLAQVGKYPVITVTGPRQSGKTTLCRTLFPDLPYVNLERPDVRDVVVSDPQAFLQRHPSGAVVDEIQRAPELPSYLQGFVDEPGFGGTFVLTGSRNFALMERVSQSLAGRSAVFTLLPFSLPELGPLGRSPDLETRLFQGAYPRIHDRNLDPSRFYSDYVATYVERDLRQLSMVRDLSLFRRFLGLVAGRVGQLLNLESLGNDCGVSQPTARQWLSLLEASWLVFRLPPFYRNIGKRLVKSPKLYFCDVGLVCHLIGIADPTQIDNHPLRGHLFENFVIAEALKQRLNRGRPAGFLFYRDNNGNEVDLLIPGADRFTALEIKSARTFSTSFVKGLERFDAVVPEDVVKAVVYAGDEAFSVRGIGVVPYGELPAFLA